MKALVPILIAALVYGCSHVEINARSNTSSGAATPPAAGSSATSGAAGLQVQGGGRGLATAVIVMGLIAGTIEYSREDRPLTGSAMTSPGYTRGAPELSPDRRISEQDCSRPVDLSSGNLRCK